MEKEQSGWSFESIGSRSSITTFRKAPFLYTNQLLMAYACVLSIIHTRRIGMHICPKDCRQEYPFHFVAARESQEYLYQTYKLIKKRVISFMHCIIYFSLWLAPAHSEARKAQSPNTLLCVTAYGLRPSPTTIWVSVADSHVQSDLLTFLDEKCTMQAVSTTKIYQLAPLWKMSSGVDKLVC